MPSLQMLPVLLRRLLARRPWIHWLVVLTAALGTGISLRERVAGIDAARRAWGEGREVLVARRDTRPGEAVEIDVRELPAAVVPPGALGREAGTQSLVARQDVSAGEVVTRRPPIRRRAGAHRRARSRRAPSRPAVRSRRRAPTVR